MGRDRARALFGFAVAASAILAAVSTAGAVHAWRAQVAGSYVAKVATWTTGPVAASVRVTPVSIQLGHGQVGIYVDAVEPPHRLADVDLASIQLCLGPGCVPVGHARIDGQGHVAGRVDAPAFARLAGETRGTVTLSVTGSLVDGASFAGTSTNRLIGCDPDTLVAPAQETPSATPSVTPATTAPPASPEPRETAEPPPAPEPPATPQAPATAEPTPPAPSDGPAPTDPAVTPPATTPVEGAAGP